MTSFEGFIESTTLAGSDLNVRLVVGGFNPLPADPPVLNISVKEQEDGQATYEALKRISESDDDGIYFGMTSDVEALLQTDHGEQVRLRGSQLSVEPGPYEAHDYERLAKANHEWGSQLHASLNRALARNNALRDLIDRQAAKIAIKLQGHETGSTARTLYEQHMDFLNRLLGEFQG